MTKTYVRKLGLSLQSVSNCIVWLKYWSQEPNCLCSKLDFASAGWVTLGKLFNLSLSQLLISKMSNNSANFKWLWEIFQLTSCNSNHKAHKNLQTVSWASRSACFALIFIKLLSYCKLDKSRYSNQFLFSILPNTTSTVLILLLSLTNSLMLGVIKF